MANAAPAEIIRYYADKTPHILSKYGPGPRVHYHTGFGPSAPVAIASRGEARRLLARAQERLLGDSIRVWGRRVVSGWRRILDVGCGLGGPAIFLAERTGAAVIDALTNVPDHIAVIRHFAAAAHVEGRVRARLADACDLEAGDFDDDSEGEAPPEPYDAAIALDSSCYLDRSRWFACLGRVLGREGTVHIVDYFAGHPDAAAGLDARWLTRLGWFEEYLACASDAGFALASVESLSPRVASFWDLSIAYSELKLAADDRHAAHLRASIDAHRFLRDRLQDGGVRYLRATFRSAR